MVDIIEVAAADVRPLRRGAPSVHPLDGSPNAVHLGALRDGALVGALTALPMSPSGEAHWRWCQLLGPFGEEGEALVEALVARSERAVTLWADSPRPGLQALDGVWQRVVEAPPEPPGVYSTRSITVLDGVSAVRKRPGMYIGSTGPDGLRHLLEELVNNALDEHLAGHATRLELTSAQDGSWTVADDGRGIPAAALAPAAWSSTRRPPGTATPPTSTSAVAVWGWWSSTRCRPGWSWRAAATGLGRRRSSRADTCCRGRPCSARPIGRGPL